MSISAQLFNSEVELLSFRRIVAVNLFARLDCSIEAYQGSAVIWIEVAFCMLTNICIVTDHRTAVVTSCNFDQCLGRHNMSELTRTGALNRICQVRIVKYDRNACACFNGLKFLTVYCQFRSNHGSTGVQEIDDCSGKIRFDLFLSVNIFKNSLVAAFNNKIDRDFVARFTVNRHIRPNIHIHNRSTGYSDRFSF